MGTRTVFKYVVLLCGLVSVETYSMEKEEKSENLICYFIKLPVDLLNSIAYWVIWGIQQDLIKQIEQENKVPSEYYKYFPSDDITYYTWKDYEEPKNVSAIFCPNKSKVGLFELLKGESVDKPQLIIVDVKKEKKEERVFFNKQIAAGNYQPIALSSYGTMIVTTQKKQIMDDMRDWYKYSISVQKMCSEQKIFKQVCTFDIAPHCVPIKIAFNKQGTHIIVQINDETNFLKVEKKQVIFDLKKTDDSFNDSNLLLNYFKHNYVCHKLWNEK